MMLEFTETYRPDTHTPSEFAIRLCWLTKNSLFSRISHTTKCHHAVLFPSAFPWERKIRTNAHNRSIRRRASPRSVPLPLRDIPSWFPDEQHLNRTHSSRRMTTLHRKSKIRGDKVPNSTNHIRSIGLEICSVCVLLVYRPQHPTLYACLWNRVRTNRWTR